MLLALVHARVSLEALAARTAADLGGQRAEYAARDQTYYWAWE